DLFQTRISLPACNKVPVDTREYRHHPETAAAGSDDTLVVVGIEVIHMDAFGGHPAIGFRSCPEILKGLLFHDVQKGRIGKPRLRHGRKCGGECEYDCGYFHVHYLK